MCDYLNASKFQCFKISMFQFQFQKVQSFKVSKFQKFQCFQSSMFQYSYEMVQCLVNMEWLRNAHMSFNGILQYTVS